jgi:hypothetical protein
MKPMKVLVLYRPNSEFARSIEEFVHDLQRRHNIDERRLQVLDYDSRDGSALASLYDILVQPAIVVTGDDGGYVKHWQGNELPRLDEVASYAITMEQA